MVVYKAPPIALFFGNKATSFPPQEFYNCANEFEIRNSPQFSAVSGELGLQSLAVIKQVHGTDGLVVTKAEDFPARPYVVEGDYLITTVPGVGLAIATADCLPIILHDPVRHTIAAVHAGWRGSVAGIADKVVAHMQDIVGSNPEDLQVFFGPSGGACCYEVAREFNKIAPCIQREGRWYFDTMRYNQELLAARGVKHFVHDFWRCTICSPEFCSYRRDGTASQRQMTIVVLNAI